MAYGAVGKVRKPGMVILLTVVTLGVYAFVWWFKSFKEIKEYSGVGLGGGLGLLLAVLVSIVVWFMLPAEVGNLYALDGQPKPVSGPTGFWLFLPLIGGIIWIIKTQGALNKFWLAHGATA